MTTDTQTALVPVYEKQRTRCPIYGFDGSSGVLIDTRETSVQQ